MTNPTDHEPLSSETDAQASAGCLSRATLTGVLGILLVLALPGLLFLPYDRWHTPNWVLNLLLLVGVAGLVFGIWLVAQVPTSAAPRSNDPLHPLTRSGRKPLIERPADRRNRIGLATVAGLAVLCFAGYWTASLAANDTETLLGTGTDTVAGVALIGYGLLASSRRVPVPAWHWVRMPAQGGLPGQVLPWMLAGGFALCWGLLIAFQSGYLWASLVLCLLIVGLFAARPWMQRQLESTPRPHDER